jgi:ABC-type multidrug transport system fused ATPase/permease subunit
VTVQAVRSPRGRLWRELGAVTWDLFRQSPVAALLLMLVLVVGNATVGAMAAATGGFVGAAVAGSRHGMALWLGVYVAATLTEQFYWNFKNLAVGYMRDHGIHRLQGRILRRAASVPLREFEDGAFYDALQRAAGDLPGRIHSLQYTVTDIGQLVVSAASLALVLGLVRPGLLVVLAAGAWTAAWLNSRVGTVMLEVEREDTRPGRIRGRLAGLLSARGTGAEIRVFGASRFLLDRWRALRAQRTRAVLVAERRTGAATTGGNLLMGLAYASSLLWVALDILHGRLALGSFVTVTVAAFGFAERLGVISQVVRSVDEHAGYVGDFMRFVRWVRSEPDREPVVAAPPGPDRPPAVTAHGLTFTYPAGTRPVLDGVDLEIAPGEHIALVGDNGAGKTTLAKCLLGLYPPDAGRVVIEGDLAGAAAEARAAVFQDYARYQFTLREAVAFGDLARLDDDAAILRALEQAGLGGLDGQVPGGLTGYLGRAFGERDLSGGQWQRLALARAFFRQAKLLVLDEATAALDPLAELALFERFAELARGRTAIMVSHRLGAARLADRVLVLHEGRIVQAGPHAELLARDGRYARMFDAQAQWYRPEGSPPRN